MPVVEFGVIIREVTSEEEEGPIYGKEKWSVGFRRQGEGR